MHPLRGNLFENMIIADIYKQYANRARRSPLYFWRDENGEVEIDCIIDCGIKLIPIEIKSSQTFHPNFFAGIKAWSDLAKDTSGSGYLIYGGDKKLHQWNSEYVVGWRDVKSLADLIESPI